MAIRFSMSEDTFMSDPVSSKQHKTQYNKGNDYLQQNHFPSTQQTNQKVLTNGDAQTPSDCDCTNISVMQLFHEMKQEFPTIPDYVVSQHVLDNCHDRENCKAVLQSEIALHPPAVQSYPAQLLQVLNKKSKSKKRPQPKKTTPLAEGTNCENGKQNSFKNNCKVFLFNDAVSPTETHSPSISDGAQRSAPDPREMRSGLCNIQIKTYLIDQNNFLDELEKETPHLPVAPQRPTTLRLNQEPYSCEPENHHANSRKHCGKWSSPITSPNQSQGSTVTPSSSTLSSPKFETSYSTSTSIPSPTNYPDTRTAEISVNVSLTPTSYRNRSGPQQRHHSSISLRPELPFTRNLESSSSNHKSYTSVNLVLRQPSSNPQTPIDITVGPNITYSSSSYHPRLGYQNNYHITVTEDGGVFSAFRIRPILYRNPVHYEDRSSNCDASNNVRTESAAAPATKSTPTNDRTDTCEIIMRQRNQIEKLSEVLRKNKNKLGLVRKEVKCVMQPLAHTDELSKRLDIEIEKLRCDCQAMLNELENSKTDGPCEDSIEHTNSIKSRHQQPFPSKQNSHRYPPSPPMNGLRHSHRSFPVEAMSQRQQPIVYNHDGHPYDFGVGD